MEVLVGALLFEVAFVFWVGAYLVVASTFSGGPLIENTLAAAWLYVGFWLVVGVSGFIALVGVMVAESFPHLARKPARPAVALLAGTLFALGWPALLSVASFISQASGDSEWVVVALFWMYLVLAPVFCFAACSWLLGRAKHASTAAV